jgi:hypothetical protein
MERDSMFMDWKIKLLIYRFNAIAMKLPENYVVDTNKLFKVLKERQKT